MMPENSQIATFVLDISQLHSACNRLKQLELVDLDEYLSAERALFRQGEGLVEPVSANKALLDLANIKTTDQILPLFNDVEHDDTNILIQQLISTLLKEIESISFEYVIKSGVLQKFLQIYGDSYQKKGKGFVYFTVIDISKRKKQLIEMHESMEKYQLLMASYTDAIIIIDANSGIIQEVNPMAMTLFGKSEHDLIGSNHLSLYVQEDKSKYLQYYEEQITDKKQRDSLDILISNNEGVIPVQITLSSAVTDTKHMVQVTFHDLRSRFKLEERRRLLATAVEQAAESVMITDPHGNIEYVNPAFEDITGYELSEVVGKNPRILKSEVASSMQNNLLWQEISGGKVWRGTFTNKKKDGTLYKEEATITPVKDDKGQIQHFVAVKRDITKQLILEKQIRQSQKMQAIGTLAGGVAHDFNNILTAILGYAELTQVLCQKDTVMFDNLSEIIKASERAGKLIDQILQFSRQGEKSISNLQIDLIIKEVLKLLRASLPANIDISSNLQQGVMVKADPTQIHQVIMNLCTNAYQALGDDGGEIAISLETVEITARRGVEIGNISAGSYAKLTVSDNGVGIPEEYLTRIFEPYFTTKSVNQGTGLGLSVVHGIINDHCGAVNVESAPGKGTKFSLYLPEAEPEQTEQGRGAVKPVFAGGRILIVDDEPPIVNFQTQVLEHLGYHVDAFTRSKDAVVRFNQENGKYDLVISDMGMPEITGLQLFEEFTQINPQVKVLLCTGFSKLVTRENATELGLAGYLAKPFNAEELAIEVSRILHGEKLQT
ncbi:hybrid sensor histidine kinase/response regulator [Desulfogranum japonicum]|uniref:hybrid sensor histidine kinase/response regulator n=1 Tax=Desulfogranum japonicum TaxID=231447 RepID=UPI0004052D9E|nr:PAS domain S-box protein [Desulfogranum japonicum]